MSTEENLGTPLSNEEGNLLDDLLMSSISGGTIVPVISNSFRMNEIFRSITTLTDKIPKTPISSDEYLTVHEQLTKEWANEINYPLPDDYNLARVAQYFQVQEKNTVNAKTKYLNFLKKYLLANASKDYESIVADLRIRTEERTFSEIVTRLEYPHFPPEFIDPLTQLANLPLPIYITTSYYNFLERALEQAGKGSMVKVGNAEIRKVRTQVLSWSGGKARKPDLPDPEFSPSPEEPVVYHLFGLENYPPTLVLSEDDYMNFLMSVAQEKSRPQTAEEKNPAIPTVLRDALSQSQLLILGYNLQDWEFRVLFRFILEFRPPVDSPRSPVIQLKPRPKKIDDEKRTLRYLYEYFDKQQFSVKWTSAESYIQKLADEWDRYTKGVMA